MRQIVRNKAPTRVAIDLNKVKKHIEEGLTINDIARKMDVSDSTLRKRLPGLEKKFLDQLKVNSTQKRKKAKWQEG